MKSVAIQSKKLDIITKITSIDDNVLLEKILQLILTPNSENTVDKEKQEIVTDLKQGLKELKMIQQGKLKSTPLNEFLNEL
jgi:hypothetical protein